MHNTFPLVCAHHSASEASIQGYLRLDERWKKKQQQYCFCSFTLTEICAFSLCSCNFSGPHSSGNITNSRWWSSGLDTYSTLICCPTSLTLVQDISWVFFWCICPHLHEILGSPKKVNKNWCLFKIYHEIPESSKTRVSRWDRGRHAAETGTHKKEACTVQVSHLEVEHSHDGREERQQLKRECAHFSHICDSRPLPHGW